MAEPDNAADPQREKPAPRRHIPPRLYVLLAVGVVAIVVALGLRSSTWAHEYQLRRANLTTLRSWAAQNPRDPLLLYYLGTKAYNANSLAEAGLSFENAVSLDPKMSRAFVGLAVVQRDIGQMPQAYASAKQAQLLKPEDPDIRFLLGTLIMPASKEKAIEEFRSLTQQAPGRADAWYWMGICQQGFNQKGEAITSLRKAVSLEPKNSLYQRDLGHVLFEMNFFDEARSVLERALRLRPDDPRTQYLVADARLKLAQSDQDLQEADALLASCQKQQSEGADADVELLAGAIGKRGEIAQRLKRWKEALAYFQKARQLTPENLSFLYHEAEVQRLLGNLGPSKVLMVRYDRLSAVANAQFQLTERIKQDPKEPRLRLELARMYARSGDVDRALNQYTYCLYLDPLQVDAKRELEALKKKRLAKPLERALPPAASLGNSP